ncbi:MAG: hypothetical protein JKY56_01050 [Kofleriaceae bacterium]|nr:hypothetical protein [Kofleriaceae bacterium]
MDCIDQAGQIEFKLYEEDSQRMSLESHWLRQQYPQARLGQSVLNVQVWGRRLGLSSTIADGITQSLQNADILLAPLVTVLDETTVESWSASPVPTFNSPTIVITEAELLGSNLDLAVDRFAGEGSNSVLLQIHRVSSDGTSLALQTVQLDGISTLERMHIDVGLVRDITIDVFDNSLLVDQLWLADGAWALFDDSLWGGDTAVDTFDTNCQAHSISNSEYAISAVLELSGCAYVDSSYVDRFVGVARHLSRGLNTKAYDSVAFWYRSSESIEACVEDTTNGHRICTEFSAAPRGRFASLSLKDLKHITGILHLVTVTQSQPGTLEVSGLTFQRVTTSPVTPGCGCNTTEPGSSTGMCAMLLSLFFLHRYRRSHHTVLIGSSQP